VPFSLCAAAQIEVIRSDAINSGCLNSLKFVKSQVGKNEQVCSPTAWLWLFWLCRELTVVIDQAWQRRRCQMGKRPALLLGKLFVDSLW